MAMDVAEGISQRYINRGRNTGSESGRYSSLQNIYYSILDEKQTCEEGANFFCYTTKRVGA